MWNDWIIKKWIQLKNNKIEIMKTKKKKQKNSVESCDWRTRPEKYAGSSIMKSLKMKFYFYQKQTSLQFLFLYPKEKYTAMHKKCNRKSPVEKQEDRVSEKKVRILKAKNLFFSRYCSSLFEFRYFSLFIVSFISSFSNFVLSTVCDNSTDWTYKMCTIIRSFSFEQVFEAPKAPKKKRNLCM